MLRLRSCSCSLRRAARAASWHSFPLNGRIHRSLSATSLAAKRVTSGRLEEVFEHLPKQESPLMPRSDPAESKGSSEKCKLALEPKQNTSGSVVIDAVRKYTQKYPLCVLLMQVGDFYEVSTKELVHVGLSSSHVSDQSFMTRTRHAMRRSWI